MVRLQLRFRKHGRAFARWARRPDARTAVLGQTPAEVGPQQVLVLVAAARVHDEEAEALHDVEPEVGVQVESAAHGVARRRVIAPQLQLRARAIRVARFADQDARRRALEQQLRERVVAAHCGFAHRIALDVPAHAAPGSAIVSTARRSSRRSAALPACRRPPAKMPRSSSQRANSGAGERPSSARTPATSWKLVDW